MAVKRYDGSAWQTVAGLGAQGAAATSSSIATWVKTASGGETSLSGNDDNSQSLSYTVGQELVFINGTLLKRGSDYTATNGTSITGLTALAANDVATVWTVNAFSVANTYTQAQVDNAFVNNSKYFVAGKNKIINGDFSIWQRGTSGFGLGAAYNADRWAFYRDGSGATDAITQQSFTAGAAPVAGYEALFFWRYSATVAGTGGTERTLYQRIEDVRTFANQQVTISFWAKADAARTITGFIRQNFGSGGSANVDTSFASQSVTTSWARYSATVTLPSISGKTIGTSSFLQVALGFPVNVTETIDIWGVQLEAGSVVTAFQTATGTLAGELAACQRYYQHLLTGTKAIGIGHYYSSTAAGAYAYLTVEMRTTPTLSATSGTNYYAIYTTTGDPFDSLTLGGDSTSRLVFLYNNSQVSGTAGSAGEVYGNSASASVGVSAEL